MKVFHYSTQVKPAWIDYNGHMQDAYYGLIFSYAVDGVQDAVGFDAAYRTETGCSIYLLEDHKYFLNEVKEGTQVDVQTRVLECDAKRFHLHMTMQSSDEVVAVCEAMELHVQTKPKPHATPMPLAMQDRLKAACVTKEQAADLPHRARALRF